MVEVNTKSFTREVLHCTSPVIVYFCVGWYIPCKVMNDVVSQIQEQHQNIKFCKVDADHSKALLKRYSINSIPTVMFVNNGQVVSTLKSIFSKKLIIQEIEKLGF